MEKNKLSDKPASRLGRGLSALIPPTAAHATASPAIRPTPSLVTPPEGVHEVALTDITTNPHQPRTVFDAAAIADLTESVKVHGVLQPIMVRPRGGGRYELVAGERRYRAAKEAGLSRIPAVIRSLTDEESLTVALIENIQREDLNPIEAARGYRQLMDEFGLTQAELGQQIGKQQSTISNTLRLLGLPGEMQETISSGQLTVEHGKVLLSVSDEEKQREIWRDAVAMKWSVKQTQEEANLANFISHGRPRRTARRKPAPPADIHWDALISRVREAFSMKVSVKSRPSGGGTLMIEFASPEEVEAILEKIQPR